MSLINLEVLKSSFKDIKEEVYKVDVKSNIKNEKLDELINVLVNDKRKNVVSLGNRLKKEKEGILKEIERVRSMYNFDKSFGQNKIICGVDEVGRGPLAGPIVSCSVILDLDVLDDDLILYLNDSKKLSKQKREELAEVIKEKAISYSISEQSNDDIDRKGIAYCNNRVFLDAVNNLKVKADFVLSDGYLIKGVSIPNVRVIKGDAKSASIAAASIVAKVYRDKLMEDYNEVYPGYDFAENAGYGTQRHLEGISLLGITDIHRKSFLTKILAED